MTSTALSGIIRNYQKLSQQIELSEDKARLANTAKIEQIKKRWTTPKEAERAAKGEKKKKEDEGDKSAQADNIRLIDDHRITWDQFMEKHKLSKDVMTVGLTTDVATRLNQEQGDNELTPKKPTPWYVKLFRELTTFFSLLMWVGSGLSFLMYGLTPSDSTNLDVAVVLIVVILLTGFITFFQNAKSEAIMEGFKNFIPQMCTVIRDGKEQSIAAAKVVRGDLLLVKEGQRIPADIRISYSADMKVDNSSLTGEMEPLLRSDKCDQPDKILETKNVAFFGTLCKYGMGRGLVFNIADATIIGQIASLASGESDEKTPLRKELDRFILMITFISIVMGFLLFILGFILGFPAVQNVIYAISVIVANVPEGLLPTITVSLAVAAKRLSARKVLVKNLESVETLGSTSCICSDKTGTLTQNVMTVENLWYDLKLHKGLNRERYGDTVQYEYDLNDPAFQLFAKAMVINTAAVFSESLPDKEVQRLEQIKEKNPELYEEKKKEADAAWKEELKTLPYWKRNVIGDASETAIIKFVQPIHDIRTTRPKFPPGKQFDDSDALIPFNSSYKFALKVIALENDPDHAYEVYLKGAPERIWDKCESVYCQGEAKPIDDAVKKEFDKANTMFAKNGERVLGFARKLLPKSEWPPGFQFNLKDPFNLPFKGFEFVGLVSLIDPPKDSVADAIEKCKAAGIKVIMVTGDQKLTATSIAKKIGIFDGKTSLDVAEEQNISNLEAIDMVDAIVVDGDMLTEAAKEDEGLPDSEKGKLLEKWLKKSQIVFARTSPAQKLYIVTGCQRLGHIVAVTGDGVNDSPAIHQADIGISMGISGSDVSKDSADMILLDDDFASIVTGVQEGRRIFDNLKKVSAYMITLNIPELAPFLVNLFVGVPLLCNTILVLSLAVGTDIFPAIGIGFEDPEIDVMTRLPRRPNEHLVGTRLIIWCLVVGGIIEALAGILAYFVVFSDFGFYPHDMFRIVFRTFFYPSPYDVFTPSDPFLGNSQVYCNGATLTNAILRGSGDINTDTNLSGYDLNWNDNDLGYVDLRLGFLLSNCPFGALERMNWKPCVYNQISSITMAPVCYTTETMKYAQTAYFTAIIFTQISNSISMKTKSQSVITQPLGNTMMVFGWIFELTLAFLIAYLRPINIAFIARDVNFFHFGFYGCFFSIYLFLVIELWKFLIRNWPRGKNPNKPNWFELRTLL